ncbi:hypothetical protein FHG87_021899 [Trinorchestia longiramus]|nr:hypothetical protein FHG87_021899 [Trinorchestia longiramus]
MQQQPSARSALTLAFSSVSPHFNPHLNPQLDQPSLQPSARSALTSTLSSVSPHLNPQLGHRASEMRGKNNSFQHCSNVDKLNEADKVDKVREADKVDKVREADKVDKVREADKVDKVREADKIDRVREADKVDKAREADKVQEADQVDHAADKKYTVDYRTGRLNKTLATQNKGMFPHVFRGLRPNKAAEAAEKSGGKTACLSQSRRRAFKEVCLGDTSGLLYTLTLVTSNVTESSRPLSIVTPTGLRRTILVFLLSR